MSVPDLARHTSSTFVVEEYLTTGFNYRLTDIACALGLSQLPRLPANLARRRAIAARDQSDVLVITRLWVRLPISMRPGMGISDTSFRVVTS